MKLSLSKSRKFVLFRFHYPPLILFRGVWKEKATPSRKKSCFKCIEFSIPWASLNPSLSNKKEKYRFGWLPFAFRATGFLFNDVCRLQDNCLRIDSQMCTDIFENSSYPFPSSNQLKQHLIYFELTKSNQKKRRKNAILIGYINLLTFKII